MHAKAVSENLLQAAEELSRPSGNLQQRLHGVYQRHLRLSIEDFPDSLWRDFDDLMAHFMDWEGTAEDHLRGMNDDDARDLAASVVKLAREMNQAIEAQRRGTTDGEGSCRSPIRWSVSGAIQGYLQAVRRPRLWALWHKSRGSTG